MSEAPSEREWLEGLRYEDKFPDEWSPNGQDEPQRFVAAGSLFTVPVQGRESDERYTPQWVFDGLGLVFDTDPASPTGGGDCVPAATKYTRDDDGLARPWHGLVWLNPPFSNSAAWADRFRAHGNGVFLGPVANGRWWQDLAADADLMWLCADFAFTHPEHAGKRSSMPLAFAAMGDVAVAGLERLAASGRHRGFLATRHVPRGVPGDPQQ